MNRFLSQGTTPPIVLATILALGMLVVWASAWVLGSAFSTTSTASESLSLTREGKAYVQRSDPAMRASTYRTLEGEPIDDASFFKPSGEPRWGAPEQIYLRAADNQSKKARPNLDWSQRVAGFRDRGSPPTYWYEIHDAEPNGSVYFAGYDSRSKRSIGYIGRGGFRPDAPPPEDQLPLVAVHDGYQHRRNGAYGSEPHVGPAAESLVYLESGGRLLGVDLARRTVREIPLPGSVVSLTEYDAAVPINASGEEGASVAATATAMRLAVRTAEEVTVLDGQGEVVQRQPIPTSLAEKSFNLYLCSKELVFETGTFPAATESHELYWVNEKGKIVRQTEVRLLGHGIASNPRKTAWQTLGVLPVPALIALGTLLLNPWDYVADGKSSNFLEALARSLNEVWPPLLAICMVGAILGLWVHRRHRRVSPRGAMAWAVFVFLAGVTGLAAYWLHRRWPAREKCGKCGTLAPRDRDECLSCGHPYPTPALLGSEIFA